MNGRTNNQRQILGEIVSIDAWHEELGGKCASAKLFVDVTFREESVGGEEDSPVRFRLALERADIVVIIPEVEPLAYDKSSVSRDRRDISAKRTHKEKSTRGASANAKASVGVGPHGAKGGLELGASAKASAESTDTLDVSTQIEIMEVEHSLTANAHNRWSIAPNFGSTLDGKPWDATEKPRLTLVDERRDPSGPLPPCVRVEIRCKREHLKIWDIEIKEKSGGLGVWGIGKKPNNLATAEAYIKDRLALEGLAVASVSEPFAQLVIASVYADTVRGTS